MTPHPEPPANCPFFYVQPDGAMIFTIGAHSFDFSCKRKPAERYAAACVAVMWLDSQRPRGADPHSDVEYKRAAHIRDWFVYMHAARAAMETKEADNATEQG